jgi:UDP-N-acetylglucosamine--N-acetylmuramyl-(pentapeptide) pyrophosphoryl-undecaprenol N-acetylglucosamine transferase
MGGSQGAAAINEVVANWVESGPPGAGGQTGRGILWQTGAATYERFRARERPPAVRVIPFLDPISDAYAAVDLVVARAGAMTLAELAAWGLPSVLIPLPTAAADHQLVNARAMQLAGAAVLIEQRDLTAQRLEAAVSRLLGDPARLADMSRAARHRGRPHAARSIAAAALRLVSKS